MGACPASGCQSACATPGSCGPNPTLLSCALMRSTVNSFCRNRGDPVQADDDTQDTFFGVLRAIRRKSDNARGITPGYLVQAAKNRLVDTGRRLSRERKVFESLDATHEDGDEGPSESRHEQVPSRTDVAAELEARERLQSARDVLAQLVKDGKLTRTDVRIFYSRRIRRWTCKEIGARLHMSADKVSDRDGRALAIFAQAMRERELL